MNGTITPSFTRSIREAFKIPTTTASEILKGIKKRLGYLKELGVDAIWITPFFPSPNADFGYDVSDYVNVAPEYGTLQDWDDLITEAKKLDIHVLVDFVVNHTSDRHPWFKESRSSRDNPSEIGTSGAMALDRANHPRIGLLFLVDLPGLGMHAHHSGTTTSSFLSSRM